MILDRLNEHLGAVLVIFVAGIGTAILAGSGAVAVIVSVGVALLALVMIRRRQNNASLLSNSPQRHPGAPFSFNFAWSISKPPDRAALEAALLERGLRIDQNASSESTVVFRGGSQLRTRLLGGYFVSPRNLPVRAELILLANGARAGEVKLRVHDSLGIGVRDRALEKRYAHAATEIERAVEDGL